MASRNCLVAGFVRYAAFRGRARRLEFCAFHLVVVGLGLWAVVADVVFRTQRAPGGVGPWLAATVLLCVLPSFAVSVRRLHDMGRSGWWLFTSFVPLVSLLLWLVLPLVPGTRGDNRHGSDPRGERASGAVGSLVGAVVLLYVVPIGLLTSGP